MSVQASDRSGHDLAFEEPLCSPDAATDDDIAQALSYRELTRLVDGAGHHAHRSVRHGNTVDGSNVYVVRLEDLQALLHENGLDCKLKAKRAVRRRVLATLDRWRATPSDKHKECSICFEKYTPGVSTIIRLPCKHAFCKACVCTWLSEHTTCPCCRYAFPAAQTKSTTCVEQ